ncbi:MAG: tocopherol cyclase family protein [Microcystaceae cyanobacterium]
MSKITSLLNCGNPLQTPHSGYHWDGNSADFFEGWYFRVTLPQQQESFAFMYSVEDPLGQGKKAGGAAQILGMQDQYLCRTFPNLKQFWASSDYLALVHWGKNSLNQRPKLLPTEIFQNNIVEGYQVTANQHQGSLKMPNSEQFCRWHYQTKPIYGWGNPKKAQQSTAGFFSFLPIFEPGWQILMAQGLATGWIEWNGHLFEFENAPAYSEKNWGFSFPEQWFWLNCHAFEQVSDLTVTAVGGIRKILGFKEEVGMVGIHYQNQFYEFAPWNSKLSWQIASWGEWKIQARNQHFEVELIGKTSLPGTLLRAPTQTGLEICCRETLRGQLFLTLRNRRGEIIIDAYSNFAGLEVGGRGYP